MYLTPSTADARLRMCHSWISVIVSGKDMARAESHTNPAGLAPGTVDINLEVLLLSFGLPRDRKGT
jgi:hypothetical protein